jgi:hypothetical protein
MKMVRFLVDAILQRDYPVAQDVHSLITLFMLLGNLLVDVTYVSLNLYLRYQSVSASWRVGPLQGRVSNEPTASS